MKLMKLILFGVLFFQLFSFSLTFGSTPPPKKVYTTKHVNPHLPVIDGKLDDLVWKEVPWESEFIQLEPYEGQKPSQQTAFKILYDERNLYVGIRAYDTEPGKIVRRLARRDNFDGDWVAVNIDSYHDLRTAFSFAVNAKGVKCDKAITEDGDNHDPSWDPIWYVKTSVDEKGWVAEMKIPFSQLRFPASEEQVWGFQCDRQLFRKQERSGWQYIPKDSPGVVHRFGELHGILGIKPKRRMEIVPYTVGKMERFQAEAGNPFSTGRLQNIVGGVDGKIGITSDLTLDFTINPDFGQVEADPSEVNLTTFETFFEEKRPFFIEGRNIMDFRLMLGDGDFSWDNLFYSRRIGRLPHHVPNTNDDEYLDMPTNTSILGALKLTGKTKSGLSIGILDSLTSKEEAEIDFLGERRRETVEPMTNYFVMRLQKDYNKGKTIIGGMVTAANRFISDSDPSLNVLHRAAYTGGFDFSHKWKNKTYVFSVNTVFSHVRGDKEAILNTQESPLRYYQRPDATHLSVDPNRTSLSGHGGTISFGKFGSGRLKFWTGVTWRSPGLELNDVGYLRSADRIMQWVWVGYSIWKPFSIFREISINLNQWRGWDFSGENIFDGGNINLYTQFKNHWGFGFGFNLNGEALSTTALRGGPALRVPGAWGNWFNIHTDTRKPLRFEFGGSHYTQYNNAYDSKSVWFGTTYRPGSNLSISVQPSFSIRKDLLQYVDTIEALDGERYIFGTLDQKTLSITVRLNLSITPDLSIQFYGQPFISAGKYAAFKHITNPRADTFENRYHTFQQDEIRYDSGQETYFIDENQDSVHDYSFDNPNFNFFQFRSNLVVRWEYFPGSTVYLVWSQSRTGDDITGDFSFGSDLRDLFSIKPHNVFLIKFTYRFNL
ncbi:MAG: hypothetical protein GTO45_08100 [Candidatus Aminicenantes bacterium]|nr:hypothetical protein [Candidatus Aminicenantes bacterium]NIM78793.1 hypothetical protein [Candidatus Aminicenantes bacterium]NIN18048.1 hypothetical protein [Candidatus Aminicenantes bacterium]NIN41948.1 hypothetical protein [Candidatus Aminicenantes bacterium]NIN84703.1 hypothetical protein [Candidatus Aminicenantes bacterium]